MDWLVNEAALQSTINGFESCRFAIVQNHHRVLFHLRFIAGVKLKEELINGRILYPYKLSVTYIPSIGQAF
jgi:hypothetical protein